MFAISYSKPTMVRGPRTGVRELSAREVRKVLIWTSYTYAVKGSHCHGDAMCQARFRRRLVGRKGTMNRYSVGPRPISRPLEECEHIGANSEGKTVGMLTWMRNVALGLSFAGMVDSFALCQSGRLWHSTFCSDTPGLPSTKNRIGEQGLRVLWPEC